MTPEVHGRQDVGQGRDRMQRQQEVAIDTRGSPGLKVTGDKVTLRGDDGQVTLSSDSTGSDTGR